MLPDQKNQLGRATNRDAEFDQEGGLRAPPELKGWRKAWWWFDFIILVKLARLRFVAILVVIGLILTQWDTLIAYYDKWTRPDNAGQAASAISDYEYFCPMHLNIIRDNNKEPCPICHMPLSRRKKANETGQALPAGVVNRVQLSPYRVALAGVQTWQVDLVPLTKQIEAVGYIEFNERGQKKVAARVPGRIDKLYVNETGQMVAAGQDLALLYSPELLVTMQNLVDGKRRGSPDLVESSRVRLKLLGIDDQQIDEALASGKADTHVRIRSPISGHVISKNVVEGQYVQEGTPLYDVADLSTVWIQAQIYEDDLALLPSGYEHGAPTAGAPDIEVTATVRSAPNEQFHGKLSFVYPHVDQDSHTVTVRFELENSGHQLRPGGTADVKLIVQPRQVPALVAAAGDPQQKEMLEQGRLLAVPESAVIDTGSQKIVYRQSASDVYDGVEVVLGPRMENAAGVIFYPVLKGLAAGDRVVTSGSFLVDAETRLNPAAGSIYFGGSHDSKNNSVGSVEVRPSTPLEATATLPEATSTPPVDAPATAAESTPETDQKISANLAKLAPDDRALADAQRTCPITGNRLGAMGVPLKVLIEGQPVMLCCGGCHEEALKDPQATLAKVAQLKGRPAHD